MLLAWSCFCFTPISLGHSPERILLKALIKGLNHTLQELAGTSLAALKSSAELLATGPESVRGVELPPFRERYLVKTAPLPRFKFKNTHVDMLCP